MKQSIYIIIAIAVFVFAFCVCFRTWADNKVFTARACFHRYNGNAVLANKKYYPETDLYGCWWKPADRPKLDERWDTCRNFEIGQTNFEYPEASYECD